MAAPVDNRKYSSCSQCHSSPSGNLPTLNGSFVRTAENNGTSYSISSNDLPRGDPPPFDMKRLETFLIPLSEKVEPMPSEPAPSLQTELAWQTALVLFKNSVQNQDGGEQKAFQTLLEVAIKRHGLENSFIDLKKSEAIKKQMEETLAQAIPMDRTLHRTSACHAPMNTLLSTNIPSKARWLVTDAVQNDPIGRQGLVVEAKTRIRERHLAALEDDLLTAVDTAVAQEIDVGLPREMTLAPIVTSIFADTFLSLGDTERAKKYYHLTSASPMQTGTGTVWFQLSALSADMQSGNKEKIKTAVAEIKEIKENIPELLLLTEEYKVFREQNEGTLITGEDFDGVNITPQEMGSPEEVHEIKARTWGLLYEAYTQLEDEDELAKLEKERRYDVEARIGLSTKYEAVLHLQNFEKVAYTATKRYGKIEKEQRSGEGGLARGIQDELISDFTSLVRLSESLIASVKDDPIMEHLGALSFDIYFKSYLSRDLPLTAIQALGNLESTLYASTETFKTEMAMLRKSVPRIFREDGSVNTDIDLSNTPEGKRAANNVMTAYWNSGSIVRDGLVPGGAGVACFTVGAIFSETIVVPVAAAIICGSGTTFGGREINKALASEQYNQAQMTGISLVSDREASINKKIWYFSNGISNLANAAFMGPIVSLWGRIGISAARTGLVRTGAWLAAESGGRLMFESLSASMQFAGKTLVQVGKGAAATGKWFWKLPIGTQIRLTGFVPAGVDYAFVDKDGKFAPFDGSLDQWWGYAGYAAGMSEIGYRFFRGTWSQPFTQAVDASFVRGNAARLAIDLVSSDYYLIMPDKNEDDLLPYKWVDFGAPHDTPLEEHNYNKQFGIDTAFGYGGMFLASSDWLQNEFRIMKNADRFFFTSGAAATAIDLRDGSLDSWYGGVGGSVSTAVLGYRLLNVSAAGSMAFIPFKLSYEWGMQAMQDVPLKTPDPRRMVSSTAESIFMMAVIKGTYQGGHYWNTFPAGKRLYNFALETPGLRNAHSIENLGIYESLGGQTPALTGWQQGKAVSPLNVRGNQMQQTTTYKLRGDKNWNGLANGNHDDIVLVVERDGAVAKFTMNGRNVTETDLMEHGYVWRDQSLYAFAPLREGSILIGGARMSPGEIVNLNNGARSAALTQMKSGGWRIVGDHFERWWVERPYHPEVLMERPTIPISTAEYKIFESSIKVGDQKIPVWLKFSRKTVSADQIPIGGKKFVTWRGERERPHFTPWGVAAQFPPIYLEAVEGNKRIFSKTSRGDPEYQPKQRGANYAPTILFTWPVLQASRGIDSLEGRVIGALFGYGPNWIGNWFYPTYRDSAPGQETFYQHLDGGGSVDAGLFNSSDAFDSFGRIITSLTLASGDVIGCNFKIEELAVKNLVDGMECRIALSNGDKFNTSIDCVGLHDATQDMIHKEPTYAYSLAHANIRITSLAKQFEKYMERERGGDLSERDRRQLLILGGWLKSIWAKHEKEEALIAPISLLMGNYGWFFNDLPKLRRDAEWSDFIKQVNQGRAALSNFYFNSEMNL